MTSTVRSSALIARCNVCCTVAGRRSLLVHYPISSQDCFCLVSAAPTAAGWSAAPLDTYSAALPTATLLRASRCSEAQDSQSAATKTSFQVGSPSCILNACYYNITTVRMLLPYYHIIASRHQTALHKDMPCPTLLHKGSLQASAPARSEHNRRHCCTSLRLHAA